MRVCSLLLGACTHTAGVHTYTHSRTHTHVSRIYDRGACGIFMEQIYWLKDVLFSLHRVYCLSSSPAHLLVTDLDGKAGSVQ